MEASGINLSNTFRIFVKDLSTRQFSLRDIKERWNKAEGLYQAISANKSSLGLFGIRVIEDIYEKIVLSRGKGQPLHIYREDNAVGY